MFDDEDEISTKKIDEKSTHLNNKLNNILGDQKIKKSAFVDEERQSNTSKDRRYTTLDRQSIENVKSRTNPLFLEKNEIFSPDKKDKPKISFFDEEPLEKKDNNKKDKLKFKLEDDDAEIFNNKKVPHKKSNEQEVKEVKKDKPKIIFHEDDENDIFVKNKQKEVQKESVIPLEENKKAVSPTKSNLKKVENPKNIEDFKNIQNPLIQINEPKPSQKVDRPSESIS
jgi:hypothetical protein